MILWISGNDFLILHCFYDLVSIDSNYFGNNLHCYFGASSDAATQFGQGTLTLVVIELDSAFKYT